MCNEVPDNLIKNLCLRRFSLIAAMILGFHFLGRQNSFLFRIEEVVDRESEYKDTCEVQDDGEKASKGGPGPYNGELK